MPGTSSVWTDERWVDWVRKAGPAFEWSASRMLPLFIAEFGPNTPARNASPWRQFVWWVKGGGDVVPPSSKRVLTDDVLSVTCKAALITSDWQVPFHDSKWADFAFEIGKGFGCDLHVINGDFLDFHSIAKFDPQLHDEADSIGEELDYAEQILAQSCKYFGQTVMDLGNHEWRLYRALLRAQIGPARLLQLLGASERVQLTEFSYVIVNGHIRCTHPRNFSRIPTRVASDLAAKHHQDVIGAHGHLIGYRRDISNKFTVIDSGGMFDSRRLSYINTVDSTIPLVNQGFVILAPGGQLHLFDSQNCDREWWLWLASKGHLKARKPVAA